MGKVRAFGATAFLCLSLAFIPRANAAAGGFMALGKTVLAPIGYRMFCREHRGECFPAESRAGNVAGTVGAALRPVVASVASAPLPLVLTPAVIAKIAAINLQVNSSIKPVSDAKLYGVEEYWTYPTTAGDCEDFVLLKRRRLHLETGIALGNLLITVALKRNGEGHAVLTLRTRRGDFVLDNLDWRIRPWRKTPYDYVKRQSSDDPNRWVGIEDGTDLLVGAVDGRGGRPDAARPVHSGAGR